jgi:hypothetical protein
MTTRLRFLLAGVACVGYILHAQPRTTTFKPCVQALQKLDVPTQIHLVQMCQVSSEIRPILTPLLSESGIEVYRLEYPSRDESKFTTGEKTQRKAPSAARYPFSVSALLVFQDEQAREKELKVLMSSYSPPSLQMIPYAGVQWYGGYDTATSGYQQDWGSIVSFKYETVEFVWLDQQHVLLERIRVYAPLGCITHIAPPQPNFKCGSPDVKSNQLGEYYNYSPPELSSHDYPFLIKVATMLAEGRRPAQHPQ